jgi:hypothetical protein
MVRRLAYEQPVPLSKSEVMAKLATNDSELVSNALVAVGLFEDDYDFAASIILSKANADNIEIRGAALVAIAHLARIHRKAPVDAIDAVNSGLRDTDEYIRGQAETAADDLERFVPAVASRLHRS